MKPRSINWLLGLVALAVIVSTVGTLAVIIALVSSRDERTQSLVRQKRGSITAGARFGVSVGDRWEVADASIRRQFKPDPILVKPSRRRDNERNGADVKPPLVGRASISYRDRTWRNGVIVLDLDDGRVARIRWDYGGPFFIEQ